VPNAADDTNEVNWAGPSGRTNEGIGASAADEAILVDKANVSNKANKADVASLVNRTDSANGANEPVEASLARPVWLSTPV
jgi:hypothetical protein